LSSTTLEQSSTLKLVQRSLTVHIFIQSYSLIESQY